MTLIFRGTSARTVSRHEPASSTLGQHSIPSVAPSQVAKEISLVNVEFSPAAVGTPETTALCNVKKGDVVLSVHARKLTLATTKAETGAISGSTLSVGDGNDLQRFIPATDTETGTAGDVVQPLAASPSSFPYVYPADDTIDIDYAGDNFGTTNPRWRVVIHLIRDRRSEGSLHMGEPR